MDIPAYSVALSQAKIRETAGLMVMKKAMEINNDTAASIVRMGTTATPAGVGTKVDIRV